jgi:hypothetical protein
MNGHHYLPLPPRIDAACQMIRRRWGERERRRRMLMALNLQNQLWDKIGRGQHRRPWPMPTAPE